MHSLISRAGAVSNKASTVAIVLATLIAVSTVLFPADTETRVELTNIKVHVFTGLTSLGRKRRGAGCGWRRGEEVIMVMVVDIACLIKQCLLIS